MSVSSDDRDIVPAQTSPELDLTFNEVSNSCADLGLDAIHSYIGFARTENDLESLIYKFRLDWEYIHESIMFLLP